MNRLECIKSMVPKCGTAADIGTDHGYVAEMLLKDDTAKKVIATDLNKGPLNRAIKYLSSKNLSDKCEFRLGSGLKILNENEAEVIIIAGMGGDLISDIINESRKVALSSKELILQPMTAVDNLRKYLYLNGFKIIDENIIKEFHHYYFIIKAVPGEDEVENEIYYEISRHLLNKKDAIMFEYIDKLLDTNRKIIDNLLKTGNAEYDSKIEFLKNKNMKIGALIKNVAM